MRVVGERRAERAAAEAEAADEPEADAAGAEVALDHRDLRQVALGIRQRLAAALRRFVHERLGDDLTRHEPDHACATALPRDPEDLRSECTDANGVLHPVRHRRRRNLVHAAPALEDELRHERLQVAQQQQVGLLRRRDGA